MQSAYQKCLKAALRLLGRRDHSRTELAGKLRLKGFEASNIARVIAECERMDYLDDARFCRHYAAHLRRRGYGVVRIEQMLKAKGLATAHVAARIREHCGEAVQIEDCRRVLGKKVQREGPLGNTAAVKARLYRFLSNRGFASPVVNQVLQECFGDPPSGH